MPDLLPMLPRCCLAGELPSHEVALARMLCLAELQDVFEYGGHIDGVMAVGVLSS